MTAILYSVHRAALHAAHAKEHAGSQCHILYVQSIRRGGMEVTNLAHIYRGRVCKYTVYVTNSCVPSVPSGQVLTTKLLKGYRRVPCND